VVTTLTEADYSKVSFTANQNSPYFWVRSSAVVASDVVGNIDAVRCSAPGNTPAQGTSSIEETELLVTSQDELNVRAGNDYAALKAPQFSQFTFEMIKTKQVFEPADMEWVTIVLPEDARARYPFLSDSGNRFLIDEVINTYDHKKMKRKTTLVATIEVEGIPAQTVVEPPQQTDQFSGYTWEQDYVPVVPDISVSDDATGLIPGTGNILMVLSDGTVAVTTDFSTSSANGGPTWVIRDFSATLGSTVLSYSYQAGATNVSAWILTPSKIWHASNLQSASPTFTQQLAFVPDIDGGRIESDFIHAPGQFALCHYRRASGGSNAVIRTINGTSWNTPTEIGAVYVSGFNAGGLQVSPLIPGKAWVSKTAAGTVILSVTTDYGATWSDYTSDVFRNSTQIASVYHPYGVSEETLFYIRAIGTTHRYRASDGSVDISPEDSGSDSYSPFGTFSASASGNGGNNLALMGSDGTKYGVFVTQNALASSPSWIILQEPSASVPYRNIALTNNANELYAFGNNGAIAHTNSPFLTGSLDSRIGNLSTTAAVRGIAGF
jgi:hypothetical protein